jgi:N-acetylmuramoyl-L-alanine amidase
MAAGNNNHHFTIYLPNPKVYQSDYTACTRLGSTMVAALKNGFPISDQLMVSKNNIIVLNSLTIPAILVECGNISNEADVAFISDPVNQKKLAKTILEGIVSYAVK